MRDIEEIIFKIQTADGDNLDECIDYLRSLKAENEQLNERMKVLQDAANADIDLAEKIYVNEYGAFDALWGEE